MDLVFRKIGSGPAIVVMHGLFGMSDNWMNIAKELSSRYTFYLLDLRNHGRSPHDDDINFELMAEDVAKFLDTSKLKDITLLGHSLGGKVAIQTAAHFPQYLKKLVVVDIANKVYQTSYFEEYIDAMLSIELESIRSRRDAEGAFLEKRNVETGVLHFLLKNLYRDENNHFKWRLNLLALKNNMNNLLTNIKIESTITTNTLFMKGSESGYITQQDEGEIKKDFQNVRIAEVVGANHWVHFSAPKNFINVLTDFQKS